MPLTICWCLHLSYLYLTMNATIEANLKANAIEKIIPPKNPDIVLFVLSWR
jgi:hypothetical protein